MSLKLTLLCFLAALPVITTGCDSPYLATEPPQVGDSPGDPPEELIQPKPKPQRKLDNEGPMYSGVVKDIGVDWLELAAGWDGSQTEGQPKKEYDNKKPKRFSVSGTNVGGDENGVRFSGFRYRLSDLKVGDDITVFSGICGKEELGVGLLIHRRPGGKIPPDSSGMYKRYQAEQDWEEKGIPIPAKYLDSKGRAPWTNPPYPPVAPQPREVKP
jgi:hypothetical protein